ncbi:MAG: heparan-alpha-glucosaminide N-acetyltransferase domain-containing protein [Pseudomonadota bacterium]
MGAPDRPARIGALDALRGLIMALMALDHTRIFFFGLTPNPTDLDATTPALFATRWITHLCAPGFVLLAGVSARLQHAHRPKGQLARRLALRGAMLVLLELTVISFGWIPDPMRSFVLLQVIWAIGWSMILLAGLIALLPDLWIGALGLALAALHPLLSDAALAAGLPDWLRILAFDANATLSPWPGGTFIISYPVLPWAGVMTAGYGLGRAVLNAPQGWPRQAAWLGLALVVGFAVSRAVGLAPDPTGWTPAEGMLAFFNARKYPPSPAFLAITLGLVLLIAAGLARMGEGLWSRALLPLGAAPLFFYILHLYALRIVGLSAAVLVWGIAQIGPPPLRSAPEWPLWAVWGIWAAALPVLFWPTAWFARYKRRRGGWTGYF